MVGQIIFLFLAHATFRERRESSTEMDVKTVDVIVKLTNRQHLSMVFTLIDHAEISSKRLKLCSEITPLRLFVPLQF